jgi:hypothetical protein
LTETPHAITIRSSIAIEILIRSLIENMLHPNTGAVLTAQDMISHGDFLFPLTGKYGRNDGMLL